VLASFAAARTDALKAAGADAVAALNGGYQLAFLLGAACAAIAAVVGGVLMRTRAAAAVQGAASHS
jgi:hypothetical protein